LLLAASVPILMYREPPRPARAARPTRAARPAAPGSPSPAPGVLASVRAALARPGMRRWLIVPATFKAGEWFATAMLRPYLADRKQSLGEIGVMLGYAGFGSALLGALLGGAATTGLGRRRALLVFGSLQTLAIASLALAVWYPSVPMFYAVSVAEHFTSSMATAALFTAMMDFSRPEEAGTDYTLQASLVVIATAIATLLSGFSAKALGYDAHFLAAAVLSLGGVLAVLTYRPSHPDFALLGPR
ncbi:MAG TPA: MFS transporter, partial [Kofleriaceae bacterium]|nr:MFS transporter [Kofleriaceae bacterium]